MNNQEHGTAMSARSAISTLAGSGAETLLAAEIAAFRG